MEKEVKTREKKVQKPKIENKTDSSNVYEISYILLPNLSNDDVSKEVASLQETIASKGGEVISFENPVLIDLAYPMVKVTTSSRVKCQKGYFGYIKFEIESDSVSEIKKYAESNPSIVRFLIIKTVRENTLVNGKMVLKKEEKISKIDDPKEEGIVEAPLDEALLDKSIDNLVVA